MAETDRERAPDDVVYREVRRNIAALLAERPDAAGLPVPACPDWTVHGLLEHLVGICAMATGRITGRPAPPPEGLDLAGLLAEWAERGERLDRLVAGEPDGSARRLTMDAFAHELDLRAALGVPPPAGHPAYPGTLDTVAGGFAGSVRAHGLPAVLVETPGARWTAGEGAPAIVLSGHPHDLFRSFTGRRTPAQLAGLSWSGDPGPWLAAFAWGPFTPPARPVEDVLAVR